MIPEYRTYLRKIYDATKYLQWMSFQLKLCYIGFIYEWSVSDAFLFISAVSKEEQEDQSHGKLPYNGYSDEFLDRLEPNGNIPAGKGDIRYGKLRFWYAF